MSSVKTIATAEPSVAPPPMIRHMIEKAPDPDQPGKFLPEKLSDMTLCGRLWDRLLDLVLTSGPVCGECAVEYKRRHR